MAIDFPASPTLNDVFTVGNVTYVWDGTKWTASVTGGISLDKIEEGNTSAEVIDTGSDGRFVVTTEGTERLRVTNTGLVGIGTNSPGSYNAYADDLVIANGSGNPGITLAGSATGWGSIYFADGTTGSEPYRGYIQYSHTNDRMTFATGGGLAAMHIDSSQRVGIGTTTYGEQHPLQIESNEAGSWPAINITWNRSSNAWGPRLNFGRSRSASNGGVTLVQNGDDLGSLHFYGADGTDLVSEAASINCAVDGTPGTNDMPGRLVFSTTADGASSPSTRMTLFSNGYIRAVETAGGYFYPGIDNSIYLGSPSYRYNLVYTVNGTASSSDERDKTERCRFRRLDSDRCK
jgi:hypothetical protein